MPVKIRSGVVGALLIVNAPVSSVSTTSLKVPPVSTAILKVKEMLPTKRLADFDAT